MPNLKPNEMKELYRAFTIFAALNTLTGEMSERFNVPDSKSGVL